VTASGRERTLEWICRISIAMCFVGHGAFGIITKPDWVPFFAVVGISRETAFALMPLIGAVDIALGISVLFRPMRPVLGYMVVWAMWTAALRPLSGASVFELLERAGNYGVPLALLVILSRGCARADRVLMGTTALLLIGHGGLAIEGKPTLVQHAALLGLSPQNLAIVGVAEIVLAGLVFVRPKPALFIAIGVWKMAVELLYPISGAPMWEFIERGGSYGAPLALAVLAAYRYQLPRVFRLPATERVAPALVLVLTLLIPSVGRAQQDRTPVAPGGISDSLKRGGFVLACRHAATDHDQSDRGATRELQRNLSAEGEAQAKSIGAVIRTLGIPIGDVFANPMFRTQETATHAFGRAVVDSTLGGRGAAEATRALFTKPVASGTNRVIVTRIGTLSGVMENHGVREIEEGDCFVLQPTTSNDFRVIARIRVQDWGKLGSR
jgi:hypothetical protein